MTAEPAINGDAALWHAGERALQAQVGMRARMEGRGAVVLRDQMPDQHRQFFVERNQLLLGVLDATGQPWATMVEGDVGFITSPTPKLLIVGAMPPAGDPGTDGLQHGAAIGILGIEFETRRRNRMNGIIRQVANGQEVLVEVTQSFGNCAQYIQARRPHSIVAPFNATLPSVTRRSATLDDDDVALISGADTFFIASRSAMRSDARSEGLDVSHRGGRAGFVHVTGHRHLTFPDYRGNFFFNTLGNLQADPRCGLLFIDFASGTTLQIASRGHVVSDPDVVKSWPGAERAVAVEIGAVVRIEQRSHLRYAFLNYAPQFDRFEARSHSQGSSSAVPANKG